MGLGLLAALLHASCAGWGSEPPQALPSASPSVWSASRPDAGSLYLMGSVHLGPASPLELGAALDGAWAEAAELVLEVDLGRYDAYDAGQLAARYARVPAPQTLEDRLGPETHSLLRSYLDARGLDPDALRPWQPWFVTLLVTVREFEAIGYDPEHGVDRLLHARAVRDGKRVVGLETLESQFAMLAGLPRDAQELMLRDMLERADDFRSEAERVISAWRRGDDAELERIVFRQIDRPEFAAFYESILFRRNRRMAERIEGLARDGEPRLVVVGVAHMLGDRGIPALLARRGFGVRKLLAREPQPSTSGSRSPGAAGFGVRKL